MPIRPKIPVMIVTGFLGAGKTTFINELLSQNHGVRIGIIENEFGDISIDARLLTDYRPERIMELNNGCICCTIYNEFSLMLQELVKRHHHLEHLIIETTGVADPAPIIEPFYQDDDLKRIFELNGTVCMVDAGNFLAQADNAIPQKQIILSDLIIVNKQNNTDEKTLKDICHKLNALNKTAVIAKTDYAQLDSLHLYMLQPHLQDEFARKIRKPFYSENSGSEYHSFTIRFGGLLDETRFREWFPYFASLHKADIFRIKGLVNFENNPMIGIVQSVGGVASLTEGSVINPHDPLENIIVFIGKEVSKYQIEKEINEFLMQET